MREPGLEWPKVATALKSRHFCSLHDAPVQYHSELNEHMPIDGGGNASD